jgi:hypothetical protein
MSDPETDPMADYERLRGDAGTVFSLPLDRKVAVAVAGLATAASFGPVITAQSAEVRALENGPGAALNIVGGVSGPHSWPSGTTSVRRSPRRSG